MKGGTLLLYLGCAGLVAYALARREAEQQKKDCVRQAAKDVSNNIRSIFGPTEITSAATTAASLGFSDASECLTKLAQGQTIDCANIILEPIDKMLRVATPNQLRFIASRLASNFPNSAQCLNARATELEGK